MNSKLAGILAIAGLVLAYLYNKRTSAQLTQIAAALSPQNPAPLTGQPLAWPAFLGPSNADGVQPPSTVNTSPDLIPAATDAYGNVIGG